MRASASEPRSIESPSARVLAEGSVDAMLTEQSDGFGLTVLDIGDKLPDFRRLGRDFQRNVYEVVPSHAAQTRFLGDIHPAPEPLELFRR